MNGNKWIPYGRQIITEEDIESIRDVLLSTNLTQGPKVAEFEQALCRETDAAYSVCVNSGTSALHIASLASGVGPGDEVITSPNTFVASANCALYCGAKPVFADIDPDTYNIRPEEIEKKISPRTRALIPVHFAGQSCDMEPIRDIAIKAEKKFGRKVYVIEDGCHALGSLYQDAKVGSCRFSDMAVTSFHPVKHITTGEGGAVLTNDPGLAKKLRLLRSHGITGEKDEFLNRALAFRSDLPGTDDEVNPWYYEQIDLGFNYRMTDIQSALGLSQLKQLASFKLRRREIVARYNDAFSGMRALRRPVELSLCRSNFHLYVLLIDFSIVGMSRAEFMLELRGRGIQTQVHYIPVHLHSYYRCRVGTKQGDCPVAEQYYGRCLSIPLHPAMRQEDVERVVASISEMVGDHE